MLKASQIHGALNGWSGSFDAEALVAAFARTDQAPEPGVVLNFLGTRIPPSVHPSILEPMAGTVEQAPSPGNWHADIAEWGAALHSVSLAQGVYRIVELGCGWGCWITNMGVAARTRGLSVELIGIEGDAGHLSQARQVLEMNGIGPDEARLVHGVAAPRRGKAIFPVPERPGEDWGGAPVFDPIPSELAAAKADPRRVVLEAYTLDDLSSGQPIDLLHIDIQGGELDFVRGNAEQVEAHVKRVLIGTHSREIEGGLTAHFLARGWKLEMERPAINEIVEGRPEIRIDGVQMWVNPALKENGQT